jgi:hypothetical protein
MMGEEELSEVDRESAERTIEEARRMCSRILLMLAEAQVVPGQIASMALVIASAMVAKDARVNEEAFIGMARACWAIAPCEAGEKN